MSTVTDASTGWQLDGDSAAAYERYLVPAIFAPFARSLVALGAPAAGERVLDLACGTGIVARHVAPLVAPGGRVVGVDVNAGMLAVAAAIGPGRRVGEGGRRGVAVRRRRLRRAGSASRR